MLKFEGLGIKVCVLCNLNFYSIIVTAIHSAMIFCTTHFYYTESLSRCKMFYNTMFECCIQISYVELCYALLLVPYSTRLHYVMVGCSPTFYFLALRYICDVL